MPVANGTCTCDDVAACADCFLAAERMIGSTIRDSSGRVWVITHTSEKDGYPTIAGDEFWDRPDDVTVLPSEESGR